MPHCARSGVDARSVSAPLEWLKRSLPRGAFNSVDLVSTSRTLKCMRYCSAYTSSRGRRGQGHATSVALNCRRDLHRAPERRHAKEATDTKLMKSELEGFDLGTRRRVAVAVSACVRRAGRYLINLHRLTFSAETSINNSNLLVG
jgi:hypothetical protein